jgi:hypothetical protein
MLKGLNYDRNITQFYGACLRPGASPMLLSEFMEGVCSRQCQHSLCSTTDGSV